MGQRSPTDLTAAAWTLLAPLIPTAQPGGRPRTTDRREVVNAILYRLRRGCQWRMPRLPQPALHSAYGCPAHAAWLILARQEEGLCVALGL